jgi:hypothetical protein
LSNFYRSRALALLQISRMKGQDASIDTREAKSAAANIRVITESTTFDKVICGLEYCKPFVEATRVAVGVGDSTWESELQPMSARSIVHRAIHAIPHLNR